MLTLVCLLVLCWGSCSFFFPFLSTCVRSFAIIGVSSEMQELQKLKEKLDKTEAEKADAVERRKALEEDLKKAASQEEKRAIQERVDKANDQVTAFAKSVAAYVNLLTELRQDLRDLKSKSPNAPGLSRVVFCCVSPPVWLCC